MPVKPPVTTRKTHIKTRMWSAGRIVLLTAALGATFLIFAIGSMRLALRSREVRVPDLTNHTASEATAIAGNAGLPLRVDEMRRVDPRVAADHVLAQDPAAGSVTRRPRAIRVWLSAGTRAATVPLLVGETQRVAEIQVAHDGLAIASVAEIRSADYPPDVIVAQTPPATSAAASVVLLVNRGGGGASYVMPDLIGVNGERAAEILRDRGFRVAVVDSTPYPGLVAGIVLRQNPQAGYQISPGEPISLEVSR